MQVVKSIQAYYFFRMSLKNSEICLLCNFADGLSFLFL